MSVEVLDTPRLRSRCGSRGVDVVLLAIWFCAGAVALAIKHDELFIGYDGSYMRELARRQFEWNVPLFSTSIDFFQGVGDLFFAGSHFNLLPSFIIASWFETGTAAKVVTYTIALVEYTLAVIVFARAVGVSTTEAFAAALLTVLLAFPIYGSGAVFGNIAIVPQSATFIAAALLIGAAFLRFGRGSRWQNVTCAVVFLGIGLWYVHAGLIGLVLAGPFLLVTAIVGLFASRDSRELWAKLGLAIAAAVIFSGAFVCLFGFLLNTAPTTAPTELANDRLTLTFASILFHWFTFGPAGPLLVIAAILGALLSIFDRERPVLRLFAITLLTYLVSRLSFWVLTVLFDFWRGPSALYFEFFVYPLYGLFAVVLIGRIAVFIAAAARWLPPSDLSPRTRIVAAASMLAILLAWITPSLTYNFPYPPKPTPLTAELQAQVGLQAPGPFRGRVATLTGRTLDRAVTWSDLHVGDAATRAAFGSEMRLVGLHHFGIPGFFQYASTMTPAFYAVTSRLLADPRDKQIRGVSVLRSYEPTLLAMLGIRFVVTDAPIPGMTPSSHAEAKGLNLYLFEVHNPNLGQYSPTRIVPADSATAVLSRMARPDFDPTRDIIGDLPNAGGPLTPARDASLSFDGVSITVRAASEGRSVLLLPLEFSRCLAVTGRSGEPVAFRANLLLTGLVFSGRLDATIALRNGPFIDPACRLRDYRDLLAAGIRDVPRDVRSAGS